MVFPISFTLEHYYFGNQWRYYYIRPNASSALPKFRWEKWIPLQPSKTPYGDAAMIAASNLGRSGAAYYSFAQSRHPHDYWRRWLTLDGYRFPFYLAKKRR